MKSLKKVAVLTGMLMLAGSVNAFAGSTPVDVYAKNQPVNILGGIEGGNTTQLPINQTLNVDIALGSAFVYDLENEASGVIEQFDLNFKWQMVGWSSANTEVPEDADSYGQVFSAGFDAGMGTSDANPGWRGGPDIKGVFDGNLNMTIENVWGKVTLPNNFYITVGSSTMTYKRLNQYSFWMNSEAIRNDLAHIRSAIQTTYLDGVWSYSGPYDQLSGELSDASIGFGKATDSFEVLLKLGGTYKRDVTYTMMVDSVDPITGLPMQEEVSETVTVYNTDNRMDLGLDFNLKGVDNFAFQAQATTGVGYDDMPMGVSAAASYTVPLNDTFKLEPFVAVDSFMKYEYTSSGDMVADAEAATMSLYEVGVDDSAMAMEISGGLELGWEGGGNYGWQELWTDHLPGETGGQRRPGLIGSFSYYMPAVDDADPNVGLAVSMFEPTEEGLIPNVGMEFLFEADNFTEENDMDMRSAYGFYVEHLSPQYKLSLLTKRAGYDGDNEKDTVLRGRVDYIGIANTTFRLQYENGRMVDNEDTGIDSSKGTVALAVIVNL